MIRNVHDRALRSSDHAGVAPTLPLGNPAFTTNLPGPSTPDIAFQFRPCLSDIAPDLDVAVKNAVSTSITGVADVRTACVRGIGGLGIWFNPTDGDDNGPARDMALQGLDLLQQGENYAALINARLIASRTAAKFVETYGAPSPVRVDDDGIVNPDAPTHITNVHVEYRAPHQVLLVIEGYDERPFPDVNFRLLSIDTLSASAGELQVTRTHEFDPDLSGLFGLAGLLGGLAVISLGAFALGSIFLVGEAVYVAGRDPNPGVGAGAAVHELPVEIMVPAKLKLVMHYERDPEVSDGGIFTGGFTGLVLRTPSISLIGAPKIAIQEGSTKPITRGYSVRTKDLRPPLAFAWTSDGRVASPGTRETNVTFLLPHHPAPAVGDVLTHQVRVQVTDADGFFREAMTRVELHVAGSPDEGSPDDGKPPICRIKPWLKVCQP